MDNKVTFVTI